MIGTRKWEVDWVSKINQEDGGSFIPESTREYFESEDQAIQRVRELLPFVRKETMEPITVTHVELVDEYDWDLPEFFEWAWVEEPKHYRLADNGNLEWDY